MLLGRRRGVRGRRACRGRRLRPCSGLGVGFWGRCEISFGGYGWGLRRYCDSEVEGWGNVMERDNALPVSSLERLSHPVEFRRASFFPHVIIGWVFKSCGVAVIAVYRFSSAFVSSYIYTWRSSDKNQNKKRAELTHLHNPKSPAQHASLLKVMSQFLFCYL